MHNLVWHDTVDQGTFRVSVVASDDNPRLGKLKVEVVATGQIILDKDVIVSYGAVFGPDVDDIFLWSTDALEVIDAYIASTDGD